MTREKEESSHPALTGRACLEGLPLELLMEISSHLCWHCRGRHVTDCEDGQLKPSIGSTVEYATLRSLSRVCRALRAAAEPFLYHCIRTSGRSDLYRVIHTLSTRNDLAPRVAEVDIGMTPGECQLSSLPPTIVDAVQSRLSRPHGLTPQAGSLEECLHMECEGPFNELADVEEAVEHAALISLLLPLILNVEKAHFVLPGDDFYFALRDFSSSSPPLTSLRRLAFSSTRFASGFRLNRAAPILRLAPNLTALHCEEFAEVTRWFSPELRLNSPTEVLPLHNLEELSLDNASVSMASFCHLIESPGPRLSKLSIRLTTKLDFQCRWSEPFLPLTLTFALMVMRRRWNGTLKELYFTWRGYAAGTGLADLKYLPEYTSLEILKVNASCLDSNDVEHDTGETLTSVLPASIRELILVTKCELIRPLSPLKTLLQAALGGQFSCLRKIELRTGCLAADEPGVVADLGLLREVGEPFQASGIDFIVSTGTE